MKDSSSMEGPQRCITFKIVISAIGVLSGASIFISFITFKNVHAALWGLLSAIFAAVVFRLHTSYKKRALHTRFSPDTLKVVKIFGFVSSLVTLAAAVTYFILMAYFKQGYKMRDDGYAPAGIFSLLTLKWTFMMFWEGRKYEQFLRASGLTEISSIASEQQGTPYNT